jgi:hypothetical protein
MESASAASPSPLDHKKLAQLNLLLDKAKLFSQFIGQNIEQTTENLYDAKQADGETVRFWAPNLAGKTKKKVEKIFFGLSRATFKVIFRLICDLWRFSLCRVVPQSIAIRRRENQAPQSRSRRKQRHAPFSLPSSNFIVKIAFSVVTRNFIMCFKRDARSKMPRKRSTEVHVPT